MSSIIRLPGLSVRERKQATIVLFSEKIAALTLKVNQGSITMALFSRSQTILCLWSVVTVCLSCTVSEIVNIR